MSGSCVRQLGLNILHVHLIALKGFPQFTVTLMYLYDLSGRENLLLSSPLIYIWFALVNRYFYE